MNGEHQPTAPAISKDSDERMADTGAGVLPPKPKRPLGGGKFGPAFRKTGDEKLIVVTSQPDDE